MNYIDGMFLITYYMPIMLLWTDDDHCCGVMIDDDMMRLIAVHHVSAVLG